MSGSLRSPSALIAVLLATSWGGTQFPWRSAPIIGLYGAGGAPRGVFVVAAEGAGARHALVFVEKQDVCSFQHRQLRAGHGDVRRHCVRAGVRPGVHRESVSPARASCSVAMDAALISVGAVNGFLISRSGHFRPQMLFGLPLMGLGYFVLLQFDHGFILRTLLARDGPRRLRHRLRDAHVHRRRAEPRCRIGIWVWPPASSSFSAT